MSDPIDPNKIWRVVCPGCGQVLGHVYARHAEHLALVHASRCPISQAQHAKAIEDMKFAEITGWTEHLNDTGDLYYLGDG